MYLVKSALTILSISFSCSASSELRCLREEGGGDGGGGWKNGCNIQLSRTPLYLKLYTMLGA